MPSQSIHAIVNYFPSSLSESSWKKAKKGLTNLTKTGLGKELKTLEGLHYKLVKSKTSLSAWTIPRFSGKPFAEKEKAVRNYHKELVEPFQKQLIKTADTAEKAIGKFSKPIKDKKMVEEAETVKYAALAVLRRFSGFDLELDLREQKKFTEEKQETADVAAGKYKAAGKALQKLATGYVNTIKAFRANPTEKNWNAFAKEAKYLEEFAMSIPPLKDKFQAKFKKMARFDADKLGVAFDQGLNDKTSKAMADAVALLKAVLQFKL